MAHVVLIYQGKPQGRIHSYACARSLLRLMNEHSSRGAYELREVQVTQMKKIEQHTAAKTTKTKRRTDVVDDEAWRD